MGKGGGGDHQGRDGEVGHATGTRSSPVFLLAAGWLPERQRWTARHTLPTPARGRRARPHPTGALSSSPPFPLLPFLFVPPYRGRFLSFALGGIPSGGHAHRCGG